MLGFYLAHAAHGPVDGQCVAVAPLGSPQVPGLLQEFDVARVVDAAHRVESEIVRSNNVTEF